MCKRSGVDACFGTVHRYACVRVCVFVCVREYLGDVIDSGVKFLLFAHHTLMLDSVEDLVR